MSDSEISMEETAQQLYGCTLSQSLGQDVMFVPRDRYVEVIKLLFNDGFDVCVDLTGVDYLDIPHRKVADGITAERFEVVVGLLSMTAHRRIRIRVQVPVNDAVLPTLFNVHPGTDAHERETYDMFGIVFEGHPDPTRILMPEDWDGHPLRKDYDHGRIPVQFKGAPS